MFDCVWPTRTAVRDRCSPRLLLLTDRDSSDSATPSPLAALSTFETLPLRKTSLLLSQAAAAHVAGPQRRVVLVSLRLISIMSPQKRQLGLTCKSGTTPHYTWLGLNCLRLTMHNVHYLLYLMSQVRTAIIEDRYPAFLRGYFDRLYSGNTTRIPQWAITALRGVGVDLLDR